MQMGLWSSRRAGGAAHKPRENRAVANTPPTAVQHSRPREIGWPGRVNLNRLAAPFKPPSGDPSAVKMAADHLQKDLAVLGQLDLAHAMDLAHLGQPAPLSPPH